MSKGAGEQGQPHFGAFITMTVGILLFFGLVSRIHDLPGIDQIQKEEEDPAFAELKQQLADERQKAFVVFGQNPRPPQDLEDDGQPARLQTPDPVPDVEQPQQPVAPREPTPVRPQPPRQRRMPENRRRYHAVKADDTLWSLARKYYGDGSLYHVIQKANPHVNPNALPKDFSLIIPDLDDMARQPGRSGNRDG